MQRPMIRCPNTQQSVPTDVAIDEELIDEIDFTGRSMTCPACGELHEFSRQDVFFGPDE